MATCLKKDVGLACLGNIHSKIESFWMGQSALGSQPDTLSSNGFGGESIAECPNYRTRIYG
jgi:hypothetical protein